MASQKIVVRGAREHNLKDISLELPRDALVVMTGLSGSGKSSLAFDTIYAEGQRRYVESLSSYARQFLGQMDKPDVDTIEGLSPAISIDQKTTSKNPRSTVGTVTEIYDYLRLLWARIGTPHCPNCGAEITGQSVEQITDNVLEMPEGERIMIMAPIVRGRKGTFADLLAQLRTDGYARVEVNGELKMLDEEITLEKTYKQDISLVVDRVIVRGESRSRIHEAVEAATKLADGLVVVATMPREGEGERRTFSERFACTECGTSIAELEPRSFSFNNPHGACPRCTGLGSQLEVEPEMAIPDPTRSLSEGAIVPWRQAGAWASYFDLILQAAADAYGIDLLTPWEDLPDAQRKLVLEGTGEKIEVAYKNRRGRMRTFSTTFEGVRGNLERRHRESESDAVREKIEQYMTLRPCPDCKGARLKPEVRAVTVGGLGIHEFSALSVRKARVWLDDVELTETQRHIARLVFREIEERLRFLEDVGIGYLSMSRSAATLSGGEAQRIRLATQIGSALVGVLYVLDEPSIGLHQRDNEKLILTLERLRDLGNTVLVVEHDEQTMRRSDYLVDLGPGAGEYGGRIVAAGTPEEVIADENSLTGQFLSGKRGITVPEERRTATEQLTVRGAAEHNLQGVDVSFPLGVLTCVTGVSGSGKSTLVNGILSKAVAQRLHRATQRPGTHRGIDGVDKLDKIVQVDQSPIGRTPRSNPATYTGLMDIIRDLYTKTPEAKARGYKPGRFSFNVKGGRCEVCKGDGQIKIEMHFLPDVYVPCEQCHGKRYNRETLEVKFKGKSIADVLEMPIDEAVEFFNAIPTLKRRLDTLRDVGLGYVRLGQPATTLSGGEAQRVKLATELARVSTGSTLYILDEPTTGLHFADVERLLVVLNRLVESGNTVVVIEHDLDVIKTADWLVDMGPEGGDEGGTVVAVGTPEHVASVAGSHTGRFLAELVTPEAATPKRARSKKATATA